MSTRYNGTMTRTERKCVAAVADLLTELLCANAHQLVGGVAAVEDGVRRMEQVRRALLPDDPLPPWVSDAR